MCVDLRKGHSIFDCGWLQGSSTLLILSVLVLTEIVVADVIESKLQQM